MSHAHRAARHAADGYQPIAQIEADSSDEGVDTEALMAWLRRHQVLLGGLVLIAAQLVWKAQFLSHMYFGQDDFYNLNLALDSRMSWHYLTFIGFGHLMIGPRLVVWLLVRHSLYDWGLASAVVLALLTCASLAALRLMRTLFGDRPVILIPLAVYLLSPITLPVLGWWSAALESLPLQLAIFMSLNAHVRYVRTGQARHLVASAAWLCFGLVFFEKALVLPVILFAVTAAFFAGGKSWPAGAWLVGARYWRAWLAYSALAAGYAVLLAVSLRTSATQPQSPNSPGAALTFAWALVKDTLLPGAIGGPWRWLANFDGSPSLAAPPPGLTWLAMIIAGVVVGASILRHRVAWRAWTILAVWVVAADMLPVIFSRLNGWDPMLHALETHYVADAVPILAICLGFALMPPVSEADEPVEVRERWPTGAEPQAWRATAMAVFGVFVFGSIWSAQAYEDVTSGDVARSFVSNAKQAVTLAPRGTLVIDWPVPDTVMSPLFGRYAQASILIGDMARGKLKGKLHWISHAPAGTIDGLQMFGTDGKLYPARVDGVTSQARTAKQGCWPERNGQIVVRFAARTSTDAWALRIGYLWYPAAPGYLTVQYGESVQPLKVTHGLHSAYLPISGSATSIVIAGLTSPEMCIGDVEAGAFGPY